MTTMRMMVNRRSPLRYSSPLAALLTGPALPARGNRPSTSRPRAAAEESSGHPEDPFRPFNKAMFTFNDWLDTSAVEPAARGWDFVMPHPVQRGISNFYDNLLFRSGFANDLMQGEIDLRS